MKCITCGKEADYLFLGNSYCEEHKEEHLKRMQKAVEKAEKKSAKHFNNKS